MKKIMLHKYLLVFILLTFSIKVIANDGNTKPKLLVDVSYHLINNEIPHIAVFTKYKIERRFEAVPNIVVKVYLNEVADEYSLGTLTTDKLGKGIIYFPHSLKAIWDESSEFTIFAETEKTNDYENASGEVTITKAKITIDAFIEDEVKSVKVIVMEKKGDEWIPAVETDTKIIIKRMAGNLSVGEDEFYTTDDAGEAVAEFMKEGIPGDKDGNINLIGKTTDHELYGNISIQKEIKWGVPPVIDNSFNNRSLFATRDKAPVWLMGLAGGIVAAVWSVILYLFFIFLKIRRAGKVI